MFLKLLYVLGYWIYFIGESITETFTFKPVDNTNIILDPYYYHAWRLTEGIGLSIIILLLIFNSKVRSFPLSFFSASSGLAIYEFLMRKVGYNDWTYQKTSTWFKLHHPSYKLWIIVLIISIISIIYLMIKNRNK